jgi:hypothetical protein
MIKVDKEKRADISLRETRPVYYLFQQICLREREKVNEKITQLMEQYCKEHASGNPNYTIENWVNPNFIATPAFFADNRNWIEYCKAQTEKEHKRIDYQIENLIKLSKIAWKYTKH